MESNRKDKTFQERLTLAELVFLYVVKRWASKEVDPFDFYVSDIQQECKKLPLPCSANDLSHNNQEALVLGGRVQAIPIPAHSLTQRFLPREPFTALIQVDFLAGLG